MFSRQIRSLVIDTSSSSKRYLKMQERSKHYLLHYKYVPGILEKRGPFREQHLGNAKALAKNGQMLYAGAYGDATGATFVFQCEDDAPIKKFVEDDPYVKNNLVESFEIKEWMTVKLD